MDDNQRISKILAQRGICSRREADYYIKRGWVFLDGEQVTQLGTKASTEAKITLSPEASHQQSQKVSILLHKPLGYVSTQAEKGYKDALCLITPENQDPQFKSGNLLDEHLKRLSVVGRLDINSKGLLVFTQDGCLAKQIIGENSPVEKEYLVRYRGQISPSTLSTLRHGLELDGKELKPARVEIINDDQFKIVLREGKKRQIRRMCELVNLEVLALKRVRVGKVKLGKLKEGHWRFLKKDETF
jgi:23S rRNA pseudouridine2604 synthase